MRRYTIETVILLVAATACALVANTMAGRERKLALVGNYGTATRAANSDATPDWVATSDTGTPAASIAAGMIPELERSMIVAAVDDPAEVTAPSVEPAKAATPVVEPAASAPAATPTPAPRENPQATRATREAILARFPPKADAPYVEVSGDDVAWLHAQGALFLDARRSSIYEQGHIAGARSFSVWESDIDDKVAGLLDQVPDQQLPIVVYCSGGECEDSHMLSQKLWGVFFENVLVYKDGYPDWQKRGGAIRTGAGR